MQLAGAIKLISSFGDAPAGMDVLWRAEIRRYSTVVDAEMEIYGVSDPRIELHWFEVKHWTKGGNARLATGKLVLFDKHITQRRWACRTPAEALQSLRARRKRQIGILRGRLQAAEIELALVDRAVL